MKTDFAAYLASLQLLDAQTSKSITLFPVTTALDGSPSYLTLAEALANGTLLVTEISQSGSRPRNQSHQPWPNSRSPPGWRGANRCQAEPGLEHFDST